MPPERPCAEPHCSCTPASSLSRRQFIQLTASGLAIAHGLAAPKAMAGPFTAAELAPLIPADKKLSADWIKSLYERNVPEVFTGEALSYIGMPVGGIGCGQLYLGGDGRLWLWDIFMSQYHRDPDSQRLTAKEQGGHYVTPQTPGTAVTPRNGAEVEQGFVLKVTRDGQSQTRFLDHRGFTKQQISFRGEYPIGRVRYVDAAFPVRAELEAFTPFIPLRAEDSGIPATVLAWRLTNTTDQPVDVELAGFLENAVSPYDRDPRLGTRRTRVIATPEHCMVLHQAEPPPEVDDIRRTETQSTPYRLEESHGYGSMALAVLDAVENAWGHPRSGHADKIAKETPFTRTDTVEADSELDRRPVASVGTTLTLGPNESRSVRFVLAWYFPDHNQQRSGSMLQIEGFENLKRQYARHFASASDVVRSLTTRWESLGDTTRLWNRTWYDSTLPHWFLDRTFISMNCLASQTSHWFDNGRFWGWEGVDCCPGTCTHVWQYAQGFGRVFPEIERHLRRDVDLGIAFDRDTGIIGHRSEHDTPAVDGQAGTILRVLREHRMTEGNRFLESVWPDVKRAFAYLETLDTDGDHLLDANQPHTLDAAWSGRIAWISSLYLAAAQACVEMAEVMQDSGFASHCAEIVETGRRELVTQLFNGEYFIHIPDPTKPDMINTNDGCHIDQVFGQSFAWQVGLRDRVVPRAETISALNHLWTSNFAPDAGGYALENRDIGETFRWYAMEGEAGLLMTTWPRGGADEAIPGKGRRSEANGTEYSGPGGYFNECMNGFEYQAASHMIYEGEPGSELVEKGLAIFKAVHDRYAASRRNPYNEIECSDHYARSMASYGVLLAVCGFDYDGPRGHIGFAPRVTPDDFKAPFIAAEGWGSFEQKRDGTHMEATLTIQFGHLRLRQISLSPADGRTVRQAGVNGHDVVYQQSGTRVTLNLPREVETRAGDTVRVVLQT